MPSNATMCAYCDGVNAMPPEMIADRDICEVLTLNALRDVLGRRVGDLVAEHGRKA